MNEHRFLSNCDSSLKDKWEKMFTSRYIPDIVDNIVRHSIIITPSHYGIGRYIEDVYLFSAVLMHKNRYAVQITAEQWSRMFRRYELANAALSIEKTRGRLWPAAVCNALNLPKQPQRRIVQFDLTQYCGLYRSSIISWIESENVDWYRYKKS